MILDVFPVFFPLLVFFSPSISFWMPFFFFSLGVDLLESLISGRVFHF